MSKFTRWFCLIIVILASTVNSHAQLFVANANNGVIGEYNTDGTVIANPLISLSPNTNFPYGLVVSGSNIYSCNPNGAVAFSTDDGTFHGDIIIGLQAPYLGMAVSGTNLFVSSPSPEYIIKYGVSAAGASLITYPLISGVYAGGIVIVGTNLYVTDAIANQIGLYSTSGDIINRSFITGLHSPYGLAITGTNLYVANLGNNTVGWYSTSGTTNDAAMITGLHHPIGLATDGTNLFVSNFEDDASGDTVGSYTLTGGTNNASLITGLRAPAGLAWRGTAASVSPVALSATVSGTNVVLSWPASGATFRLRENTNLATTTWVVVTNVPVVNGTTNQVTLPATNTAFFDLINP